MDNKQEHQTQTHAHTSATHNLGYKKLYTVSSEDYTEVTITDDNYPQMFTEEIQLTHKWNHIIKSHGKSQNVWGHSSENKIYYNRYEIWLLLKYMVSMKSLHNHLSFFLAAHHW
jgi:hypothetical protein